MDNSSKIEPISAYHKDCPHCGSPLFAVNYTNDNDKNSGTQKPDKECHCCGKKFIILFGC